MLNQFEDSEVSHEKTMFSQALRRFDAETTQTKQQNFDIKLCLHLMEQRAISENRMPINPRRLSNKLSTEQFYDFENSDEQQNPNIPQMAQICEGTTSYNYNKSSPDEISNQTWTESNRDPFSSAGAASTTSSEHQLITQTVLEDDLKQISEQNEMLESQLVNALTKISSLETLTAKLDNQVKQAKSEAQVDREELEKNKHTIAIAHVNLKQGEERRNAYDRETVVRTASDSRALAAEKRVSELNKEKKSLTAALENEKQRVVELQHVRRKSLDARDSKLSLQQLLQEMDSNKSFLQTTQYTSGWREHAIKNMDLCLKILYACENEVSDKRRKFIKSCSNSLAPDKMEALARTSRTTAA